MMQDKRTAGSWSNATGKRRVTPRFKTRELADTFCTNAPHGKYVPTTFFTHWSYGRSVCAVLC